MRSANWSVRRTVAFGSSLESDYYLSVFGGKSLLQKIKSGTHMLRVLFYLLAFTTVLSAQETLDRVLVEVDQELILESEIGQQLQRLAFERKMSQSDFEAQQEDLKYDLVQAMIDNLVILAEARADTNIVVQDRDVDRQVEDRLEGILRQVGGEKRLEEAMGLSLKEIRRSLTRDTRQQNYIDAARRTRLAQVSVTRQEVETFFETFQDSLPSVSESVLLSHIFLEYAVSAQSEQHAKALADSVRGLLDPETGDPTRFAELAEEYSTDPGSAANGGSIGRTKRGNLVRPYEEVAYRMEIGQLSEPVRSEYGFHVIRLDGRQGEYIETSHILFKLEATAVDRQIIMAKADSLYTVLAGGADFAEQAGKHSDHAFSRGSGGDLGWISLTELLPLVRSRVRDLEPGSITRPVRSELEGREGMQILQLRERRDSRRPTLEDDWEEIRMMSENHKKQRVMQEWVDELRSQVHIRVVD
jgi:peptidyl-prolyl cis-trans isomerase SurA